MFNPNKFFTSKPLNSLELSLDTEWEHLLIEANYDEWKKHFKEYLDKNYLPSDKLDINEFYEQFCDDLNEFKIKPKHSREFYLPTVENVQKGDLGEALGSFLFEKCFNVVFPVLPWARKMTPNKPLSNFDLIGYNYDKKDIRDFLICTSKLSPKKSNLNSLIGKACKEFTELNNEEIILRLYLFRRAFKNEFKEEIILEAIRKHIIDKKTIKIMGIFTGPSDITFDNCGLNFVNINNKFPCFRHLIKYFNIEDSIKYFF